MNILSVKNLTKSYTIAHKELKVLKGINFDIQGQSFNSILGKSGSGKSTLLNLIGGLDLSSEGEIWCMGKNISTYSPIQMSEHRKHFVGMVFQSFNLIPHLSALENIELPLIIANLPPKLRREKALHLLEKVGLQDRAKHRPNELSGGESQRVAIARAIANEPKLLLADEPTGNLDSSTGEEILNIFHQMIAELKITVLMITHDREIAKSKSDTIIELKDGIIISHESSR